MAILPEEEGGGGERGFSTGWLVLLDTQCGKGRDALLLNGEVSTNYLPIPPPHCRCSPYLSIVLGRPVWLCVCCCSLLCRMEMVVCCRSSVSVTTHDDLVFHVQRDSGGCG